MRWPGDRQGPSAPAWSVCPVPSDEFDRPTGRVGQIRSGAAAKKAACEAKWIYIEWYVHMELHECTSQDATR